MESKINYQGITDYSKRFAQKALDPVFSGKNKVNGEDLLNLTGIRQINLFVLKNIFQKWKTEIDNMKSPFFDYGAKDVQDALQNLMNVLSRNILVSKEDLFPMLTMAVQQTILIIYSPYDFYRTEFSRQPRKVADLKDEVKFIKINRHLIETIIAKAEKNQIQEIDAESGVRILNEALEETTETPEEFEAYHEQFSALEPLELSHIYSEPAQDASLSTDKYVETGINALNERFAQEQRESLAEIHQRRRIESIRNNLTINQRFMFINELFKGNAVEFNAAIDAVESQQTYEDAVNLVKNRYAGANEWDMESEAATEFFEVVSKRFN